MLRIGLLGSRSWKSSAEYYHLINELVRERLHSAECVPYSVDFTYIEELQQAQRRDDAAGAEGVILGCTEIELLIRQADATVHVLPPRESTPKHRHHRTRSRLSGWPVRPGRRRR